MNNNKVLAKVIININNSNDFRILKRLVKKYGIQYVQCFVNTNQNLKSQSKIIYKIIFSINSDNDFKNLIQLIKQYNIKSIQFYAMFSIQQIRALKKNKNLSIVYGDVLKQYNHDSFILINH